MLHIFLKSQEIVLANLFNKLIHIKILFLRMFNTYTISIFSVFYLFSKCNIKEKRYG